MAKFAAGEADIRLNIFLPHHAAGDHRQIFRRIRRRIAKFFLEQIPDLAARQVHRGENDVIRRLVPELHDEFAEVAFDDGETLLLQRVVQMNFLARHRLGLDDAARLFVAENLRDDFARLRAGAGPVDFRAACFELGDE